MVEKKTRWPYKKKVVEKTPVVQKKEKTKDVIKENKATKKVSKEDIREVVLKEILEKLKRDSELMIEDLEEMFDGKVPTEIKKEVNSMMLCLKKNDVEWATSCFMKLEEMLEEHEDEEIPLFALEVVQYEWDDVDVHYEWTPVHLMKVAEALWGLFKKMGEEDIKKWKVINVVNAFVSTLYSSLN